MSHFQPLPPDDEDALHTARLLNVEERHYKRVLKTLVSKSNPINEYLNRKPTTLPPSQHNQEFTTADEDEVASSPIADEPATTAAHPSNSPVSADEYIKTLKTFHHSVQHDYTSFLSSLARTQFLLRQNATEVERYRTQSTSITAQCSEVKSETTQLRSRLRQAQQTMDLRRKWDTQAQDVLFVKGDEKNGRRKTRAELTAEMDKLRNEIDELQREGEELNHAWLTRREVFADVVSQGRKMRRVVRGEPETEGDEDADGDARSEGGSNADGEHDQAGRREEEQQAQHLDVDILEGQGDSHAGTPRPTADGGATPIPGTPYALQSQDVSMTGDGTRTGDGDGDGHASSTVPAINVQTVQEEDVDMT